MGEIPAMQSIFQYSWVVNDLDEAMERWHRTTGVGPFIVQRHIAIDQPRHRGNPQPVDFSVAIAQAGPAQVELIHQHDDAPSCYRDTVPKGTEALHHAAIMVPDYDKALAHYTGQGFAVASDGYFGEVRFCYVDMSPALGMMMEIVHDCAQIREFFDMVTHAAETWDGDTATLVREL